jgi:hypothetical protein
MKLEQNCVVVWRMKVRYGVVSGAQGLGVGGAAGGREGIFKAAEFAVAHDLAELRDEGIVDEVNHFEAGFAAVDEVGIVEGLEVAGGVGLGEAEGLNEGGDGMLAFEKGFENAEAGGFAEGAEAMGDGIEEGFRNGMFDHCLNYPLTPILRRMVIMGHQLVKADCRRFAPMKAVNQYHLGSK